MTHLFSIVGYRGNLHAICKRCDVPFAVTLKDDCPGDIGQHPNLQRFRKIEVLPELPESAFNMQIDPRMKRRGARIRTREQELASDAASARDAILGA